MYNEKVMDHFANPRNMGDLPDADGVGRVGNPTCGDVMQLAIKVKDNKIEDVKFKTFGCGAAIATSSMVTEMVKGKTLQEALEITNRAVAEELGGLPANKLHCSNLAADALHVAIKNYIKEHGGADLKGLDKYFGSELLPDEEGHGDEHVAEHGEDEHGQDEHKAE